MNIRTLLIDDEPIALEKLRKYAGRVPSLEVVGACNNGLEALALLADTEVDLIITDIDMPDLNGIDLARSLSSNQLIIFTTAYSDYAIDGFKLAAVDYLLKPYGFVEFNQAINKVAERLAARRSPAADDRRPAPADSLFVKVDHRYMRISLDSILYIKGYGEYLQIYTTEASAPFVTLSSFAAIKERLADNFLQVHRSYIVNMSRIGTIDRNRILIDGHDDIPVGESFKQPLLQYVATFAVGKGTR
ncbi:MAG: response regulator transcription factor [Muribaculaceae bacterium]|nr:response regulator transcription factor [Muribaculaceae bacterium]